MTVPQHPRVHVWSLMVQAGIDGQIAHEALADLITHVQKVDADKLQHAHPSLGDGDTLDRAADYLRDPDMQAEYIAPPTPSTGCTRCYPHGPKEPCTCTGCTSCVGREIGCTCDIDWDCEHKEN